MKRYCSFGTDVAYDQTFWFEMIYNINRQEKTYWTDYICFSSSGYISIDSRTEVFFDESWSKNIYKFEEFIKEE